MAKVSAIILGAGLSRRMGEENKLFLPIGGKPMIEWVIQHVGSAGVDEIILVGSELSLDRLKKFENTRTKVVDNPDYQSGMTSSIQAGVEMAAGDGYMICLGDQPNIKTPTYDVLLDAFSSNPAAIVLPFYQGEKGNPVILPKVFHADILAHEEPEGCKGIVMANKELVIQVDVDDPGVLQDIDTKTDYDRQVNPA